MSTKRLFILLIGLFLCAYSIPEVWAAGRGITYNDSRFAESVDAVMAYLEGSFGAMIMAAAGIATVICAAFGQYRLALGLLIVAVGAFALRSLVSTFFNDASLDGGAGASSAMVRMKDDQTTQAQTEKPVELRAFESGNGVEIFAPDQTAVRAFDDGTVTEIDNLSDHGTSIVIKHFGGRTTSYGNLDKVTVRAGQSVKAGAHIGFVGTSGLAKGSEPRLYFELKQGNKKQSIRQHFPSVAIIGDGELEEPSFLTDRIIGDGQRPAADSHVSAQMELF